MEVDPSLGVARYAAPTIDHFQNPRNVGRLPDADAAARIDDEDSDTTVSLYVKFEAGRVSRATFRTLGCSACVAASSVATELLHACSPAEFPRIDADAIDAALGGLPPDKRYCAELVARAITRLLHDLNA